MGVTGKQKGWDHYPIQALHGRTKAAIGEKMTEKKQPFCTAACKQGMESIADVGQQGKMPCALNRDGQLALMVRAGSGYAARQNLGALRKKPAELGNILIINRLNLIDAE
jgi:hypothetical protein